MSSQLPSLNPTGYLGTNDSNPGQNWYRRRDPLPSDYKGYTIGDRWINTDNLTYWGMTGRTATSGTWVAMGGGSITVEELLLDDANLVSPIANVITLKGNATQGVSTFEPVAGTAEITVADAASSQKGVVTINASTHNVLVGGATGNSIASVGPGSAGQVLQSGGASANPSYSTATYPSTTAQGDLLLSSTANTIGTITKSTTATQYIANTGSSNNAQWDYVNLANGVTGILSVANGGTGVTQIPSFSAYKSANTTNITGNGNYVAYVCDTVDFNVGSGYNGSTGIFTAPIAGKYYFRARCAITNCTIASAEGLSLIHTNSVPTTLKTYFNANNRAASAADLNCEINEIIDMAVNDTCYPMVYAIGEVTFSDTVAGNSANLTCFNGVWVGP